MGYSDHSLAATITHDTLWTSVPGTPLFKHKLGPNGKSYPETFLHCPSLRGHMYSGISFSGLYDIRWMEVQPNYTCILCMCNSKILQVKTHQFQGRM